MSGVEHKIVPVTGGRGALGRALAEAFVKQGCSVDITAGNPARLPARSRWRRGGGVKDSGVAE